MEDEQKKTEETHEHHTEVEHHARHDAPEHHEHHPHHEHHEEVKHHPEHHAEVHKPARMRKTALWQLIAAAFAVLFIIAIYTHGFSSSAAQPSQLSKDEAATKVIDYINKNLLAEGVTAKLNSVKEENGLYFINMTISGQTFASYASKDGELFFPQAFDTTVKITQPETQPEDTPSGTTKSDKPKVELFVMSHCPYGTQAEKGILPAVEKLGNKIDFSIKFVYYAMHGDKEVKEQMNQVCIMNEQKDKFFPYLKCFLNSSDGAGCIATAGIDKAALSTCVAALDEQYSITANYNDKSTWISGRYSLFDVYKADNTKYGIGGSPTLVINGAGASPSSRSPAAYLASICATFNTPPAECDSELSTTTFSPGFGYTTTDSTALAECG
ncbi:MAG: hypothetical protein V1702_01760 [Candidatus Woesearchaeota archaeon]